MGMSPDTDDREHDKFREYNEKTVVAIIPESTYMLDISKGNIPGTKTEFKFGRSAVITAVESIVWDGAGNYTFLTAAETMDIVSDSADDTLLGAGARTIVIYGLDADYLEISEVIEMDGLNPVTTQKEYLRVYRMLVLESGTNDPINDANKGNITAISSDTTTLQAKMLINNGQTLMLVYTVPAGKTGYVTGLSFSAGQGKQILFKAKFRNGPSADYAFSVKYTVDLYQTSFIGNLVNPLRIPEKTDAVITAQTSSGTIDGSGSFGLILVDN